MISLIKALPIPKEALKKKGLWSFVRKGLQHDIFLIVCALRVYFYLFFCSSLVGASNCRGTNCLRRPLLKFQHDLFSKMKQQKIDNCLFHMGPCRVHIFTVNAVCWWCWGSFSIWGAPANQIGTAACKSLPSCRCENASKDYNSVAYQQQRATCYSKEGGFM